MNMTNLDFSLIIELLRADGSITVNKSLIQAIGLNEAVLYCELLSRYNYFKTRETLDEEGYFYNTQYDLQAGTGLGEKAQRTAINNLKKIGLIQVERKGLPAKRYFKIISNSELLARLMKDGKEKAERLANPTDTSIGGNLKRPRKELDAAEGSGNNTHYNNTNLNNTKSLEGYKGDVSTSRVTDVYSFDILNRQIDKIFKEEYEIEYIGNLTNQDIKHIFAMFYEIGNYRRGIKPSKLKTEQVQNIIESLPYIGDFEPSVDDYRLIIEDYFTQDFPNCDYNINHFVSGDILQMRVYNLENRLEI